MKSLIKKILLFTLLIQTMSVKAAFAQSATTGENEIDKLLATGVNVFTAVAGLAIVISVIAGGIQYMSASGNSQQVSAAKNRITVSLASLLMLGFGYALLQWLIPGGIFK